jgi:hypothetical protein
MVQTTKLTKIQCTDIWYQSKSVMNKNENHTKKKLLILNGIEQNKTKKIYFFLCAFDL